MIDRRYIGLIIAIFLLFSLTSCYKMRVEVHGVPSNTPEDATIYISGNFNRWDPGDQTYVLAREDSIYYVDLPLGIGEVEYKFTRGDWTTVEKGLCGEETYNRVALYGEYEVVIDEILSWNDLDPIDCQHITVAISALPENTPPQPRIAIAGNINNWDPLDDQFLFSYDTITGLWILDVPRINNVDELEFLITRGSLERPEADALGEELKPRIAEFGRQDTVFIEVQSWEDLEKRGGNFITLILDRVPSNTPAGDPIYFVGEINDWFPKQGSLMLERNREGKYFINLPLRAGGKRYKLTRGSWGKEEVDKYGYKIEDRVLNADKSNDTVRITVDNWIDLSEEIEDDIRITITSVPENTPEDEDLYLASNFNGWDPGDREWRFERADNGDYFIDIPRSWGTLAFKVTRGNWGTVESTAFGSDIDDRVYLYKDIEDVEVRIRGWIDKGGA